MKRHRYWVVRCRSDFEHVIPLRQAVDGARSEERPTWPNSFQAVCPHCGKKENYAADDIILLADFQSRHIPLSSLPPLPAVKREGR
jgi:hypothetical protein